MIDLPTFSTTPVPSWPRTAGRGVGAPPSRTTASVWQTPVATILTRTSLSRIWSSSSCSRLSGAWCSRATAAVTVVIERYFLSAWCGWNGQGRQLLQVADRVFFDVLTHACLAELAPDAAFLHSAEGHAQVERLECVAVDEGAARLDLAGETSFGVGRPDPMSRVRTRCRSPSARPGPRLRTR